MRMPAITLWQPWASWIALGWKTVETRTHARLASLAGRRIAIHSGQAWDVGWLNKAGRFLPPGGAAKTNVIRNWRRGVLVCTAHVVAHRVLNDADSAAALCDCSPWGLLWGLVLDDVRPLKDPLPCKGGRGIWYVELADEAARAPRTMRERLIQGEQYGQATDTQGG